MDPKFLVLTVAIFVCCGAAPPVSEDDRKYIYSVLENVPEAERKQFVIHQLYKGYVLTHPNDIALPVSAETTQKLYEVFLKNYLISPTPSNTQVFDQLCFPSGECIDTDDPGAYP